MPKAILSSFSISLFARKIPVVDVPETERWHWIGGNVGIENLLWFPNMEAEAELTFLIPGQVHFLDYLTETEIIARYIHGKRHDDPGGGVALFTLVGIQPVEYRLRKPKPLELSDNAVVLEVKVDADIRWHVSWQEFIDKYEG